MGPWYLLPYWRKGHLLKLAEVPKSQQLRCLNHCWQGATGARSSSCMWKKMSCVCGTRAEDLATLGQNRIQVTYIEGAIQWFGGKNPSKSSSRMGLAGLGCRRIWKGQGCLTVDGKWISSNFWFQASNQSWSQRLQAGIVGKGWFGRTLHWECESILLADEQIFCG